MVLILETYNALYFRNIWNMLVAIGVCFACKDSREEDPRGNSLLSPAVLEITGHFPSILPYTIGLHKGLEP